MKGWVYRRWFVATEHKNSQARASVCSMRPLTSVKSGAQNILRVHARIRSALCSRCHHRYQWGCFYWFDIEVYDLSPAADLHYCYTTIIYTTNWSFQILQPDVPVSGRRINGSGKHFRSACVQGLSDLEQMPNTCSGSQRWRPFVRNFEIFNCIESFWIQWKARLTVKAIIADEASRISTEGASSEAMCTEQY